MITGGETYLGRVLVMNDPVLGGFDWIGILSLALNLGFSLSSLIPALGSNAIWTERRGPAVWKQWNSLQWTQQQPPIIQAVGVVI